MELIQLVTKAQAGNQEALLEICKRFENLIKKYAWQQHTRSIAEEAVAEGTLALLEGIHRYNPALGVPFAGFVESRIKFAVWNLFKKERRRWQCELPLHDSEEGAQTNCLLEDCRDIALEVVEKVLFAEVQQALAVLPLKQQDVIISTLLGEKSLTQVALSQGITPQGAYNLRKRGLMRLKSLLAGMYVSEGGEKNGSCKNTAKQQAGH